MSYEEYELEDLEVEIITERAPKIITMHCNDCGHNFKAYFSKVRRTVNLALLSEEEIRKEISTKLLVACTKCGSINTKRKTEIST